MRPGFHFGSPPIMLLPISTPPSDAQRIRRLKMNDRTPQLWAADPHKFGPGKIHLIDLDKPEQTYCGKMLAAFSGRPFFTGEATCLMCRNAPLKRKQQAAESEARQKEWEKIQREHADKTSEWWKQYNEYLASPEWKVRREAVLQRAGFICEGCGVERAIQVHHLTYDHVGYEMLWELKAVCLDCHAYLHPDQQ